jgi:hypothetical protein
MATKKISVNPEYFKIGKPKTLKKERKKSARNSGYKENKELKMKLINKIKEHKKMEKDKEKKNENTSDNNKSIQHDLNNSLDYLQSLSEKHKSKKEKRRERKMARRLERQKLLQQPQMIQHQVQPQMIQHQVQPQMIQQQQITTSSNDILNTPLISLNNLNISQHPQTQPIGYVVNPPVNNTNIASNDIINTKPDPPYGILKHGKKPLFSMYNKTLKKPKFLQSSTVRPISNLNSSVHTDNFFQRQQNLNNLKQKMSQNNLNTSTLNASFNSSNLRPGKTFKKMKQLKTTTKRFIHLGKKDGRVGVLIKNQKTRKKILKDTNTLKKRPLSKIKQYLRKHNLIKIGSTAPEHIIRSIYENSFLSGDIYNKNVDMLLHNYLDS